MKLFYYKDVRNFGDLLNLYLLNKLNVNAVFGDATKADAVMIGSLLQVCFQEKLRIFDYRSVFRKPLSVYGTGLIYSIPEHFKLIRRLNIYGLRGFKTYDILKKIQSGIHFEKNIAFGDPALLLNKFYYKTGRAKRFELGIIPHYVDKSIDLERYIDVDSYKIIEVQAPVENVLEEISECETIISSAMHGLIVADALRVPNRRIIMSDKITGGDFKFNDYYSVFGKNNHEKIHFGEKINKELLLKIKNNYDITDEKISSICSDLEDVIFGIK